MRSSRPPPPNSSRNNNNCPSSPNLHNIQLLQHQFHHNALSARKTAFEAPTQAELKQMLDEAEYGFVMADKIGTSLLAQNRELQEKNEFLEASLATSRENMAQLKRQLEHRCDLFKKLQLQLEGMEEEQPNGAEQYNNHQQQMGMCNSTTAIQMERKIKQLEGQNNELRTKAKDSDELRAIAEKREEQRVGEYSTRLRAANLKIGQLEVQLGDKARQCETQADEVKKLLAEITQRKNREKMLWDENGDLSVRLDDALTGHDQLCMEMKELQERHLELSAILRETEEELKQYQDQAALFSGGGGGCYPPRRCNSVDSLFDSLASELEAADSGCYGTPMFSARYGQSPHWSSLSNNRTVGAADPQQQPSCSNSMLPSEAATTSELEKPIKAITAGAADCLSLQHELALLAAADQQQQQQQPSCSNSMHPSEAATASELEKSMKATTSGDAAEQQHQQQQQQPSCSNSMHPSEAATASESAVIVVADTDVDVDDEHHHRQSSSAGCAVVVAAAAADNDMASPSSSSSSVVTFEGANSPPKLGVPGRPGTKDLEQRIRRLGLRKEIDQNYQLYRTFKGLTPIKANFYAPTISPLFASSSLSSSTFSPCNYHQQQQLKRRLAPLSQHRHHQQPPYNNNNANNFGHLMNAAFKLGRNKMVGGGQKSISPLAQLSNGGGIFGAVVGAEEQQRSGVLTKLRALAALDNNNNDGTQLMMSRSSSTNHLSLSSSSSLRFVTNTNKDPSSGILRRFDQLQLGGVGHKM